MCVCSKKPCFPPKSSDWQRADLKPSRDQEILAPNPGTFAAEGVQLRCPGQDRSEAAVELYGYSPDHEEKIRKICE